MRNDIFEGGMLRERYDDATRSYVKYTDKGVQESSRPYTAKENAEADARAQVNVITANRTAIETQAATTLAANKAFVGIASPTNAQSAAQVKALTRQVNGIIRLVLGKLDASD